MIWRSAGMPMSTTSIGQSGHSAQRHPRILGTFKADTLNVAKLGELNAAAVRLMDRAGWKTQPERFLAPDPSRKGRRFGARADRWTLGWLGRCLAGAAGIDRVRHRAATGGRGMAASGRYRAG